MNEVANKRICLFIYLSDVRFFYFSIAKGSSIKIQTVVVKNLMHIVWFFPTLKRLEVIYSGPFVVVHGQPFFAFYLEIVFFAFFFFR